MRWIDTFVHALRQSKVDHTGHFVIAGAAYEVNYKIQPFLIRNQGEELFQCRGDLSNSFVRFHAIQYLLNLAHN